MADYPVFKTPKYLATSAELLTAMEARVIPHLLAVDPTAGDKAHADCPLYEFRVPKRRDVRVYYLILVDDTDNKSIFLLLVVRDDSDTGSGPTKRGLKILKSIVRKILALAAIRSIFLAKHRKEDAHEEG